MAATASNRLPRFLSGKKAAAGSEAPLFLTFRSSRGFIAATVCLAIFTDIFLYGIIVPVLPFAMTSRIGIPNDSLQQWNAIFLACYTIAVCIGSPVAGIYADHSSSRRWPLLLGLLALAGSTLLLCLGQSVALFVVGRLLQGLSAAIVWSVGLALLADTFGNKIGVAMGYTSIAMSLGLLAAPAIGGAVFDSLGYYAVFYIAFGCIFLDIILRLAMIEKKVARQWVDDDEEERSDIEREQTLRDGREPLSTTEDETDLPRPGLSEKSLEGGEPNDMPRLVVAATASATATAIDRSPAKYPRLRLIKSRRMLVANWGIITQSAVMLAWDTVLPLYVKETFSWDSTAAGLLFFSIFIPGFLSPIAGHLSDRYGARWPSFSGFLLSIPILVCLRFVSTNTIDQKVLLAALLALMGVTLTFSNTPLMAEITYAIEAEEKACPGVFGDKGVYGLGYGLFCTSFALGGTIGALMSGYVMAGEGWATLTWVLAVWMAGAAVVVGLWAGEGKDGPLLVLPFGGKKRNKGEGESRNTASDGGGGEDATDRLETFSGSLAAMGGSASSTRPNRDKRGSAI